MQVTWKRKKGYDKKESALKALKFEQEIFAHSSGTVESSTEGQPLVVQDWMPIISIGSAEEYEVSMEEDQGLKFLQSVKLKKHSASQMVYIGEAPSGFGVFYNRFDALSVTRPVL